MGKETGGEANQDIGVPRGVPSAYNLQFRWMQNGAEMRMVGDPETSRTIAGYCAIYNSEVELYPGTREVIRPGAFNSTDMSKEICLFNHNYDQLLATCRGNTLMLSVDDRGLAFEADVAKHMTGDAVLELVRRGDIQGCSFSFWVKKEAWTDLKNGEWLREILEIEAIDDVGPVTRPAYEDTNVSIRSYYDNKRSSELRPPMPNTAGLNDDWRILIAAMEETHNA